MRVNVEARRNGGTGPYVLECSDCGPLGVVTPDEAIPTIKDHLRWHGVDNIEEQP